MTKKQRRILFSVCVFLFIITSTSSVLYSQGYRFDFKEKKITQSGAFYIEALPKSVQIEINNKPKDKTDIFFGTAYIDNLLPQKYKITIKKDGYHPWEKNLEVKEKQITKIRNIVLFPINPSFHLLSKDVVDFFFSPNNQKIVTLENQKQNWSLKIYDIKTNIKSKLLESQQLAKGEIKFLDLKFSPDSKKILLKALLKEEMKYFLIDLTKEPDTFKFLTSLDFLEKNIEKIDFFPQENQYSHKLFFSKDGNLRIADLTKKEILPTQLTDTLNWITHNNNIYYLKKDGYLYKTDTAFSFKEKINETNLNLEENKEIEIILADNLIFLKKEGDLYFFNSELKVFEKLFENTKNIKISPDAGKLMYSSNSEIWVLFLKDQTDQPQKSAGEKVFLTRFSEKIGEVSWINSHYLVFNIGKKIKIVEIDDRDQINIVDLTQAREPKIFFNRTDKKLYILSEGNLSSLNPLIK